MPHISLKENPSVFTIEVKQKGTVGVDVVELSGKLLEAGVTSTTDEFSPADVEKFCRAVGDVMFSPNGSAVGGLTDAELFAVGATCLNAYNALGKEPGGSPTSQPPTA